LSFGCSRCVLAHFARKTCQSARCRKFVGERFGDESDFGGHFDIVRRVPFASCLGLGAGERARSDPSKVRMVTQGREVSVLIQLFRRLETGVDGTL
jgi:hypothetical protein